MPKNTTSSKRIVNIEHYRMGYEALVNKNYETAIREFTHYITHGGANVARAHYRLAEAYIKESKLVALTGRYQNELMTRALPYLNRAIELRNDYADAYALRAQYWKCLGREPDADRDLASAASFRKSEQTSREPQATEVPVNKNLQQTPDEMRSELNRLFQQLQLENDPTQRIGILEKVEGLLKLDTFLNRNANEDQLACVYADMQAQYHKMNALQQAIEYGRKAFDLYKNLECAEQTPATKHDYKFQMAQTLLNIGTAQNDSEAILSYAEAMARYNALLMTELGRESQVGMAKSFYNIGIAVSNLGNMGTAILAYKQALIEFNSEKFPGIAHQYQDEIEECQKLINALAPPDTTEKIKNEIVSLDCAVNAVTAVVAVDKSDIAPALKSTRHIRLSKDAWSAAKAKNLSENAILDHIRGASRLIRANPPLYEQAIAHIETNILKADSDSIEGNLHLAFIYSEWAASLAKKPGNSATPCYEKAISIYNSVLRINPGNVEASKALLRFEIDIVTVLITQKRWDDALISALSIVQKDPAGGESHICLGNVYRNQAEDFNNKNNYVNAILCCDQAISCYKTACQKDPKASQYLAEIYCVKGDALVKINDQQTQYVKSDIHSHEAAIDSYSAARKIDPKNMIVALRLTDIYTKIINTFIAQKRWSAAISWLKERVIINKDDAIVGNGLLGLVYYTQGIDQTNNNKAVRYYDKAISCCNLAIPDRKELIRYYKDALQKVPTNHQASDCLKQTYYNHGHSLTVLGNSFQNKKQFADAILNYDNAIISYQDALRITPKDTVILKDLIATYLFRTHALHAQKELTKFIQKDMIVVMSWITDNIIKKDPNSIVGYDILVSLCESQAKFCSGKLLYRDAILCYDRAILRYSLIPKTCSNQEAIPKNLNLLYSQLIDACYGQIKLEGQNKHAVEKLLTKIKETEAKLTVLKWYNFSHDNKDLNDQAARIPHFTIAARTNSPIYSPVPPASSATAASTGALMMSIAPVPK